MRSDNLISGWYSILSTSIYPDMYSVNLYIPWYRVLTTSIYPDMCSDNLIYRVYRGWQNTWSGYIEVWQHISGYIEVDSQHSISGYDWQNLIYPDIEVCQTYISPWYVDRTHIRVHRGWQNTIRVYRGWQNTYQGNLEVTLICILSTGYIPWYVFCQPLYTLICILSTSIYPDIVFCQPLYTLI